MFSEKIKSMSASPIRKFAPYSIKAKQMGKKILPLNIGQPDLLTPPEFLDAVHGVRDGVIAYTPSNGIDPLLNAFVKYYKKHNMPFDYDDLLITNGGSEALNFVFTCLCDPGDEMLVFEPYYANYNVLAKYSGIKLVPVRTKPEDNFRLPPYEEIVSKCTDKTRGILVTNPNNPTGLVLNRDEMDSIVRLAKEKDIFIVSDEVYREFIYNGNKYISFTEYSEIIDRLVVVDSVSKRYSGCGLRIGCIASKNTELIAHALKLCQARLCVPYVEQVGAAALFDVSDDYINACVDEYRKRRDICMECVKQIENAECKCPDGAFYFILGLPIDDADKFTAWMLTDFDVDGETVMLCPAAEFYATKGCGKNEIRISYCICSEDLKRAMDILAAGVKAYNSKK